MKLFACRLALVFLGLIITLSLGCTEKGREAPDKGITQKDTEPNVVAIIGDYTITKDELEKKLMMEIRPNPYEFRDSTEITDAKTVLMKMIAEKAMVIEARKQNLQEDEMILVVLKKFKEKNLVNLLLRNHLQSKINITDSEIDEKMKSDPKLDRVRAKAMLTRAKSGKLLGQY